MELSRQFREFQKTFHGPSRKFPQSFIQAEVSKNFQRNFSKVPLKRPRSFSGTSQKFPWNLQSFLNYSELQTNHPTSLSYLTQSLYQTHFRGTPKEHKGSSEGTSGMLWRKSQWASLNSSQNIPQSSELFWCSLRISLKFPKNFPEVTQNFYEVRL